MVRGGGASWATATEMEEARECEARCEATDLRGCLRARLLPDNANHKQARRLQRQDLPRHRSSPARLWCLRRLKKVSALFYLRCREACGPPFHIPRRIRWCLIRRWSAESLIRAGAGRW